MVDVTFFISSYVVNITFGSWRNFQKSKMWSHTEPYGTEKKKHFALQQRMPLKQMSSKIRKARPYQSQPVRPQRSRHLGRRIQRRGGGDGSRTPRRPSHPEPRRWSMKHIIATADILRTWPGTCICPQQRQNSQQPSIRQLTFVLLQVRGSSVPFWASLKGFGSNLDQNTDRLFWLRIFMVLLSSSGEILGQLPILCHYCFLTNSFLFILTLSGRKLKCYLISDLH